MIGYAKTLARTRVKQLQQKPFLGKPFLRYGQCLVLWSYFFQLGGILGAKYSDNLDAFGQAFLGMKGESGAIKRSLTQVAVDSVNRLFRQRISLDWMTFYEYVMSDQMARYGGHDESSFLNKHGMDKVIPDTAVRVAWEYAGAGTAVAVVYPDSVREMFEVTHAEISDVEWRQARSVVDLPPEQDRMSYEDVETADDKLFMVYLDFLKRYPDPS